MATIDYISGASVQTNDYVGKSAYRAMYKRLKDRIDGVYVDNQAILDRLDVIETEATNVIALTNEELQEIMNEAAKTPSLIDYTKTL